MERKDHLTWLKHNLIIYKVIQYSIFFIWFFINISFQSDIIVAEVTQPSLGVGYELGRAVAMKKPILCLYRPQVSKYTFFWRLLCWAFLERFFMLSMCLNLFNFLTLNFDMIVWFNLYRGKGGRVMWSFLEPAYSKEWMNDIYDWDSLVWTMWNCE